MGGQQSWASKAGLRHVTSSAVLPYAGANAASEVPTVIPAAEVVEVVLTPWTGRDLSVPCLIALGFLGPWKHWQRSWEASATELTLLLLGAVSKRGSTWSSLEQAPFRP